jgi:hypothetical protein
MTELSRRMLFWAPRAISIAFIAFLSLFALDVFGEGYGFGSTLLALAKHLVPSFVLIAVLVLAWRWEWIGAVLFTAAGLLYVTWVWDRPITPALKLNWILTIAGPAFAIAALFGINWLKHDKLRAKS